MLEMVLQESKATILIGDFKCNKFNPDSHAGRLNLVTTEFGFSQMITNPTGVTQNTETLIDLLFNTKQDMIETFGCSEVGMSVHVMIYGMLDTTIGKEKQKQHVRKVRDFRKCNQEKLINSLRNAPWGVMESLEDLDSQWEF